MDTNDPITLIVMVGALLWSWSWVLKGRTPRARKAEAPHEPNEG